MLTIYLSGTNVEYMEKFVDFVNESLIGWGPLVNDEFTVSEPRVFEDGEVTLMITVGTDDGNDNVLDLNYDEMFMPREHITLTRSKWNR